MKVLIDDTGLPVMPNDLLMDHRGQFWEVVKVTPYDPEDAYPLGLVREGMDPVEDLDWFAPASFRCQWIDEPECCNGNDWRLL